LQCVAVCCSVFQCAAVCCSVLQCVAVCCSVLQCVAASVQVSVPVYVATVAQMNVTLHKWTWRCTYQGAMSHKSTSHITHTNASNHTRECIIEHACVTWLIGTWLIGTWLIGTWLIGTWLIDECNIQHKLTESVMFHYHFGLRWCGVEVVIGWLRLAGSSKL